MSPEATMIWLFVAFVAFVVGAVLSAMGRSWWNLTASVGLAAWVLVPFWAALKAI